MKTSDNHNSRLRRRNPIERLDQIEQEIIALRADVTLLQRQHPKPLLDRHAGGKLLIKRIQSALPRIPSHVMFAIFYLIGLLIGLLIVAHLMGLK